jgi:hypothetical protein
MAKAAPKRESPRTSGLFGQCFEMARHPLSVYVRSKLRLLAPAAIEQLLRNAGGIEWNFGRKLQLSNASPDTRAKALIESSRAAGFRWSITHWTKAAAVLPENAATKSERIG